MPASSPKIRIAISGGDLAGALLMYALQQYEHLDAHLFESADAFRTAGMAIGLARNAQQALSLIGAEALQFFERAGAVAQHGARVMFATGPDVGKRVDADRPPTRSDSPASVVHRAVFLQQILDSIPSERMHASKKLERTVQADGKAEITLHFGDGTTHVCDVLVGADGIHSVVRKIILGETDPAVPPRFSGVSCLMSLQPYEKMRSILGDSLIDRNEPFEYGWAGNGAFMMHDILSQGDLVQFIVAMRSEHGADKREVADVKKAFQTWPSHLQDALAEILGDQDTVTLFGLFDHQGASTFVKDRICMVGDAAHASTPWQGSGGAMSVEDVLILSSLLGHIKSANESDTALLIYDEARRARSQRIVESSYETGLIFIGDHEKYSLSLESLNGRFFSRWDFIIEYDNARATEEALHKLDSKLHG